MKVQIWERSETNFDSNYILMNNMEDFIRELETIF